MELNKYKLGECLELQRGYDLTSSQMQGGKVAVVGSNGIIGYHNSERGNSPCITVGRSGSVGKVHYYEQPTWAHNTTLFLKDFKGNNPKYLYYLLKNLHLDNTFEKGSSVIPSLDRNLVHSLVVPFHKDINDQRKIVTVLSAIDRKIELNRQINDNLEAMAKQLYDYWFVQFDFPNEEGKPYKSSGGAMAWNEKLKREIPEGWYAENICKIANILSGGTPSKAVDEYWNNGTIPFFGPTDCNGSVFQIKTADHITQKGLEHCASSLFEEGIVIITARGSIGKLVIVGTPMAMNQSCYALQSKEGEYEYLYFLTTQLIDCLKAKGSGSVFKSIIASDIEHSTLCIATENVVSDFCKKVKPLFEKLKANTIEIAELTKQRDELLPLLMNGQASVNYHLSAY
ncbi:restriction endonuclease subunit S [uncultured Prevotella sp.]|uniref:restriction endonuclease subunit S n=1 Tax=uncultured Prevotella sp. TaxID=159272 RepID=UPI0025966772|nr:restriction endonuclease subunit S [uncultured Prevotella sp.]